MALEVCDAGVIRNLSVCVRRLVEADAVLHDHERQLVALLQHVQYIAQAYRIDGPSPVGFLDVGILYALSEASLERLEVFLDGSGHMAHVVAESIVVHFARCEDVQIPVLHLDLVALALPLLDDVGGIVPACLHIAEEEGLVHFLERRDLVHRAAGLGIGRGHGEHAANLEIGVDLVSLDDRLRGGHEFMVRHLIEDGIAILVVAIDNARIGEGSKVKVHVALVVDLIERHPVLDLVLVPLEADHCEPHEEVHQLAVPPAAVFGHQMIGQLEMGKGDDRLDAVLQHLVKEVVVELQPLLIRLRLVALREDAGPCDAGAEALEAHLCEESDIFFIAMVKIDCVMVRVVLSRQHAVRDFALHAMPSRGHDIRDADPLAAFLPAAFQLMRGNSAAP